MCHATLSRVQNIVAVVVTALAVAVAALAAVAPVSFFCARQGILCYIHSNRSSTRHLYHTSLASSGFVESSALIWVAVSPSKVYSQASPSAPLLPLPPSLPLLLSSPLVLHAPVALLPALHPLPFPRFWLRPWHSEPPASSQSLPVAIVRAMGGEREQ